MDKTVTSSTSGGKGFLRAMMFQHMRWEYLAAGVSGGVISTLALHPLDLVKIRFQVHEGYGVALTRRPQYQGLIHALKSIFSTGGFQGLYQGVTPNFVGAGMSWGLYFFFYNSIKTWMQEGNTKKALAAKEHMLIAAEAGLLTLALTNPIWVTKTRMCLQYEAGAASSTQYKGMLDALVKLWKYEGIRGYYKGFVPGILGIAHGAIQFTLYEEMKNRYNQHKGRSIDYRLGTLEYLGMSAVSKIIAATCTYPYQVLRSRLQEQHSTYTGVIDVVRKIFKYEGVRGFYKGIPVYLVHVTPNICIVFMIYEYVINWKTWQNKDAWTDDS
ncbi:mitochondrial folate transporter/carrier-like isoform X2 [Mya arenaria]|uniref:mitochondrial folate transporter/carrier-like isoform X2 n=1 Tax=Mya arenaria TaxID=6604 RepID=UPI0022E5C422|nr:mitochondrial folate transporter/carrier-like isoform X2 [Mya arenaria]XP_052764119.1 mitochondrial folate transporter/carrier-like isoform X2 [Mya arenaria]